MSPWILSLGENQIRSCSSRSASRLAGLIQDLWGTILAWSSNWGDLVYGWMSPGIRYQESLVLYSRSPYSDCKWAFLERSRSNWGVCSSKHYHHPLYCFARDDGRFHKLRFWCSTQTWSTSLVPITSSNAPRRHLRTFQACCRTDYLPEFLTHICNLQRWACLPRCWVSPDCCCLRCMAASISQSQCLTNQTVLHPSPLRCCLTHSPWTGWMRSMLELH